jgi:predicted HicB family RNase H-like nuclease
MPDALHRDLKVWAAQDQVTLNELLISLLKAAVEKHQGGKK